MRGRVSVYIVEICVYTTESYDTLLALTTYSGSLFAPKIFFALVCFPGGLTTKYPQTSLAKN